jgi:hypothetical protein
MIRYSAEEVNAIYNSAVGVWKSAPGMTLLEAARAGLHALPTNRRRKFEFIQNVTPALRVRLEEFKANGGLHEEPVPVVPPVPAEPPAPVQTPLDLALEQLAEHAASVFVEKLKLSLRMRMEGILQLAAAEAVREDTQRKRKVLIIGLTQQQFTPIQEEFAKLLDVRWKPADVSTMQIRDSAQNMDLVIQTKWSSHHVSEALKSAGIKFTFLHGGLEEVRAKLEEFYALN